MSVREFTVAGGSSNIESVSSQELTLTCGDGLLVRSESPADKDRDFWGSGGWY